MPRIPKKREGSLREKGKRITQSRGKKSQAARQLIETGRLYSFDEALDLLKKPELNSSLSSESEDPNRMYLLPELSANPKSPPSFQLKELLPLKS